MLSVLERAYDAASLDNLSTLIQNPSRIIDFFDGVRATRKKKAMDMKAERNALASRLSDILPDDEAAIRQYQDEIENNGAFYDEFDARVEDLKQADVLSGTTSTLDAQTLYVVCRAIEPSMVVETGTRYGAFDAHITAALAANEKGKMISVDLPGAVNEYEAGYLIPDEYRSRWEFREGDAQDILDSLLEKHDVDLFLHDSLHTRKHMRWEYSVAEHHLPEEGVIASHDVLKANVFQSFAAANDLNYATVRNAGVAVKQQSNTKQAAQEKQADK